MHAFNLQAKTLSLAERLADLAVDALIDEADLSPKPALVDRRGSGAHTDLHLGLMHASALALWPAFKEMAEVAIEIGEIGLPARGHRAHRSGRRASDARHHPRREYPSRGHLGVGPVGAAAALEPESTAQVPSLCAPHAWPCSTTAMHHGR
jgi:triphosphoribosyl-dephospho-CoA synthase